MRIFGCENCGTYGSVLVTPSGGLSVDPCVCVKEDK